MLNVIESTHCIVRMALCRSFLWVLFAFLPSCTSRVHHEDVSFPEEGRAAVYFITDNEQKIIDARIDGREVRKVTYYKKDRHDPVSIRSGIRNIAIWFSEENWPYTIFGSLGNRPVAGLNLIAIARRTYEVHFKAAETKRGLYIWTWAIDRATSKVVAGERPSEADLK